MTQDTKAQDNMCKISDTNIVFVWALSVDNSVYILHINCTGWLLLFLCHENASQFNELHNELALQHMLLCFAYVIFLDIYCSLLI